VGSPEALRHQLLQGLSANRTLPMEQLMDRAGDGDQGRVRSVGGLGRYEREQGVGHKGFS
ncbi:hypothetical protein, partial [Sphingobium fuliginis]|uniref:hypothetical protein n=1 Tax=Sphingobium fuliginis (strain ATCC 27551) TaxID=336203 RepID=UPI001C2F3F3C